MPKQTCLQRCAGVWARGGNSGYGQLKGGHYHSETDDLRARFKIPEWGVFCHTERLRDHPARLKLVLSDSAITANRMISGEVLKYLKGEHVVIYQK